MVDLGSSNGWGPFETDRSNGDQPIGDGRALTLGGVKFTNGLGVHSPSEIDYYLGGSCSTLTATVGIDDEVQGQGSVAFKIYADDKLVADSGPMFTATPAKSLAANVSGADTVKLVLTDGGDNIEFDHGDWAEPTIDCA
jgi:alpha-galactosidase